MTGVRVVGPEVSGLAEMLGAVIRGNLQQKPTLARALSGKPGVVRVTAADIDLSVTIELRDGCVRVYSGDVSPPDVEIVTDSDTLSTFSTVPRLGALPHPLRAEGRAVIGKTLNGRLKLRGAVVHGKLLRRVQALLVMDPV